MRDADLRATVKKPEPPAPLPARESTSTATEKDVCGGLF